MAAEFLLRGLKRVQGDDEARKSEEQNAELGTAALFLVPTCDLVSQQKRAVEKWIGEYEVAEYFGGKSVPDKKFDVLVSTPQAFLVCSRHIVGLKIVWNKLNSSIVLMISRRCNKLKPKQSGMHGRTSSHASLTRFITS